MQEARRLRFASRRCGLEAPPSLDGRASLHFSLGAVRSPNTGPCAPCGASPPVPRASQHARTRERGPHLLVLACAADSTRRPVGQARFACPARGLCLPQQRGVMRRKAHTGGASPPKPNGSGDPFLRGRKNCFWLPPCPSLGPLGWTLLRGLRKTFQLGVPCTHG